MIWLLRDFDYFSVLLRALTLAFELLTVGGAAYLILIARPMASSAEVCWRWMRWAAIALTVSEASYVAIDTAMLMGSSSLRFADLRTAPFLVAGVVEVLAGLMIVTVTLCRRAVPDLLLLPLAMLVLGATVFTSHSASRLDHRLLLGVLTAAHQVGASLWLGAMPFLLLTVRDSLDPLLARRIAASYSRMAIVGVGVLLLGGGGLAWFYLGLSSDRPANGLYGTAYGVMLLAKVFLFLIAISLGAGNYFLVRGPESSSITSLTRLRRFGEAEIAFGFTAVLAAASMTAQPPAIDVPSDRVSLQEMAARFHPVMPRMSSPAYSALVPATPLDEAVKQTEFGMGTAESDANDRAWSEYNHHWSGWIVLAAGGLALLSRLPRFGWARQWPIVFAGLAVLIVLRADPDSWPLGPRGFWGSFYAPDVLQHRFFALLVLAFAGFEWGVQTGRLQGRWAAMVFPLLCAGGGALLLTHSHGGGDSKEELLTTISHTPVALFGVAAGWSRWLELRLPDGKESRIASYLWPICLVFASLMLLNYRES